MSCSFASVSRAYCGPSKKGRGNSEIIPLLNCKKDVSYYLRSLRASGVRGRDVKLDVTEIDLILNRAGMLVYEGETVNKMSICPRRRNHLTVNWPGGKAIGCRYPFHDNSKKTTRTGGNTNIRRITKQMSEEIFWLYDAVVPIGEGTVPFLNLNLFEIEIKILVPRIFSSCKMIF